MRRKKGQETVGASILILLMGVFILLYVILLPPADRAELLNITEGVEGVSEIGVGGNVLLSESPGKVYSYSSNIQNINIEPIHIYSKEEKESFNLVRSMTVSNNLLKDNHKAVYFNIDDLAELKDVQLFFLIRDSKGPIMIYLNGKLLYDGELTSSQLPLDLPFNNLQQKNKLEFYSASPGFRIFSSNYYLLQDIQVLKTLKVEKTQATRTFNIGEVLGERLRRASLNYFITCNSVKDRPTLTIALNHRKIYEDAVFCDYLQERSLPLTKTSLNVYGRNKLDMIIDQGDINVDEIKVKAELTQATFPTYTLDVSSDLWMRIQDGDARLQLRFSFADDSRKRMKVSVQDTQFVIDSSGLTFTKDISAMVDNGANTLRLEPYNNFEIVNLKVFEE